MITHASTPDDDRHCPQCNTLRRVLYAWRDGTLCVQCMTCFTTWKEARRK